MTDQMNSKPLFKTDDLEIQRTSRGAISFAYDDANAAMFDLYGRIAELEEQVVELKGQIKESVEFEESVIQLADKNGMDEDWSAYGESQEEAAVRFLDARLDGADITADTWMARANGYEKERDSLVVLLRRWEAAANHIFGTQEICRVELMAPISVTQAEAIEYAGKRLWDEVGIKILNKAKVGVLSYTKSYADEIRQQAQEAN